MPTQNVTLADILDRDAAVAESENLLAALVDGGVFVPVNAAGSVIFMNLGEKPALPGFASEEHCVQYVAGAVAAVHCDAMRLADIGRETRVPNLALFSTGGWAKVPTPFLFRALANRGHQTQGDQSIHLSWSTDPLAIALRDATRDRLLEFPGIQTVWIARVRWMETGVEQLMLHFELSDDAAPDVAKRLMDTLLSEHVSPGEEDPMIVTRVLNSTTDADFIRQINRVGLDTIRADHTTGQISVISREYD